jgi:hypothetical protein
MEATMTKRTLDRLTRIAKKINPGMSDEAARELAAKVAESLRARRARGR